MIAIRQLHFPEDYEAVARFWKSMERGVNFGPSDTEDEVAKKITRDPDLFLIAENGDELIGTIIGGFDGRRGMIYHLAVASAYRERGVGSQLLAEVEKRLRAKGCLKCYLLVLVDNVEAAVFYEHHGWQHMSQDIVLGKELS